VLKAEWIGADYPEVTAGLAYIKAFLPAADNKIARVKLGGGLSMRIDLHVRSTEVSESSRSGTSSGAEKKRAAVAAEQRGHDEAHLSFSPARVRELERMAREFPDLRKDRVESLKSAIQDGRYEAPAEQVSSAMLRDALARGDLFRR
jgi:flagellar biosynthesis anti-sigma factor FlgM